jgi:hypothetical protein
MHTATAVLSRPAPSPPASPAAVHTRAGTLVVAPTAGDPTAGDPADGWSVPPAPRGPA